MNPEQLTAARLDLRLSQSALARLLGIDRATLIRWENGQSRIPRMLELALATMRDRKPGRPAKQENQE